MPVTDPARGIGERALRRLETPTTVPSPIVAPSTVRLAQRRRAASPAAPAAHVILRERQLRLELRRATSTAASRRRSTRSALPCRSYATGRPHAGGESQALRRRGRAVGVGPAVAERCAGHFERSARRSPGARRSRARRLAAPETRSSRSAARAPARRPARDAMPMSNPRVAGDVATLRRILEERTDVQSRRRATSPANRRFGVQQIGVIWPRTRPASDSTSRSIASRSIGPFVLHGQRRDAGRSQRPPAARARSPAATRRRSSRA